MIRKFVLCIILFYSVSALSAQDSVLLRKWSFNTAYLVPVHKWESGIFQPFRYGISNRMELRSNALWFPFLPNIGLKIARGKINEYTFASEHSISYPTLFLNIVSRKGIGGLISPEYDFPFILSINNSLLISREITSSLLATGMVGFVFALRGEKPDPQATIDLPVFYPRMAHDYEGTSIRLGTSVKGRLSDKWFFQEGIQIFIITRPENNFFFENTGSLMWAVGKSLRIRGGYVLAYGKYPYVNPKWQLWPTLDFVFGSK